MSETTLVLKKTPEMTQSTIRVHTELLREAQYYLRLQDSNMTKFFAEKLHEFVHEFRHLHPDRVPGGMEGA